MKKCICIVGTLDTKGREIEYIRQIVESRGLETVIIDTGIMGKAYCDAHYTRQMVAKAAGQNIEELVRQGKREVANPAMASGATVIAKDLLKQGKIHAILSVGGSQGTSLSASVMRALPIGFPKVMVSTMASGDTSGFVDINDIAMMFSVADIMGLNKMTRVILANAAGAAIGMAETEVPKQEISKPAIAVTTVGITTACAMKAIEVLEENGFEPVIFHTVGSGGRAMEHLIEEGFINGVLDISVIELVHHQTGCMFDAGAGRLTAAGRKGIPQVVIPGSVSVLVFIPHEAMPVSMKDRQQVAHTPQVLDVRCSKEEQVAVGIEMGEKLSAAKGKTKVFVPMKGFDSYSNEGNVLYNKEADAAFVEAFKDKLRKDIPFEVVDMDINDEEFAVKITNALIDMMKE